MDTRTQSCKSRWFPHKNSRLRDLRRLFAAYQAGEDSKLYKRVSAELGDFHDYGLCFDYVTPGTFNGQREGYWRYQLSWGGPSDEFRFYASSPESTPHRIEYVFLDWFDGCTRKLRGKDEAFLTEIWNDFQECGMIEHVF